MCKLQVHEEGSEADKGGYKGADIGAPGACCVGEHVVVRALEGDAPLFVAADFSPTESLMYSIMQSSARSTSHTHNTYTSQTLSSDVHGGCGGSLVWLRAESARSGG